MTHRRLPFRPAIFRWTIELLCVGVVGLLLNFLSDTRTTARFPLPESPSTGLRATARDVVQLDSSTDRTLPPTAAAVCGEVCELEEGDDFFEERFERAMLVLLSDITPTGQLWLQAEWGILAGPNGGSVEHRPLGIRTTVLLI